MKIFKKFLPSANIYLVILKKNALIIDTGDPHSKTKVISFLKEKINGKNLSYIFITHSHWDHVGNASLLKKIYGSKVVIGEKEREWVLNGYIDIPSPKGSLYSILLYHFLKTFSKFEEIEKFKPDVEISKYEVIDIEGKKVEIFPTPGHTPGSLTFKIDEFAFTGDTLLGPNPFFKRPRLSMFLYNREEIYRSIEFLKELNAKIYFPGHGLPFTKEELLKFGESPL